MREELPARVVEESYATRTTPEERNWGNSFPLSSFVSRRLPRPVEVYEWRRGWEVFRKKERLYRWGVVLYPNARIEGR